MDKTKINNLSWDRITGMQNMKCEVPTLCPVCHVSFNPTYNYLTVDKFGKNDLDMFVAIMNCNYCGHKSVLVEEIEDKTNGHMLAAIPEPAGKIIDSMLSELSPRFVQMYQSAERCESNGDFDLAGTGFRASLEILLKDYALSFQLDTKENIAKTSLNRCINSYFTKNGAGFVAADVVRILGNDYVHWDRADDFDSKESLKVEKEYLDIFISYIKTQIMIKNPPVSRNHSSNSNNGSPSKS